MIEGYRKLQLDELQGILLKTMKYIHSICVKYGINYYIIGGTLLGAVRHKGFIPWDDDMDIAMLRPDYEKFKSIIGEELKSSDYILESYETDPYFQPALTRILIPDTILDVRAERHLKHRKNIYFDIFPLDNAPDTIEERATHAADIKKIDRRLGLRFYKCYDTDNSFRRVLKKMVSVVMSIEPLSRLRAKRIEIMTRYNTLSTERVVSTVSQYRYEKQAMPREYYGTPGLYKFEDSEFYGPAMSDKYLRQLYGNDYMELPPVEKRRKPADVYAKIK